MALAIEERGESLLYDLVDRIDLPMGQEIIFPVRVWFVRGLLVVFILVTRTLCMSRVTVILVAPLWIPVRAV